MWEMYVSGVVDVVSLEKEMDSVRSCLYHISACSFGNLDFEFYVYFAFLKI